LRKYGDADLSRQGHGQNGGKSEAESSVLLPRLALEAALVRAASDGDTEAVEELLRKGARVNFLYIPTPASKGSMQVKPSGCAPLHAAAEKGSCAVAKILLQKGASVNGRDREGGTALHRAAYWGQHEIISVLIEHGADPAARDQDGMSPLHNAAIQGKSQVAGGLVAAGAPVDAGDEASDTPLHLACLYGHTDTAKKLLQCNAAVNVRNKDNVTALHNAVAFGHTETVALLLKAGADCNIPDAEGNTALHTAVMVGRADMVAFLLAHEADCSRMNQAGQTPYKSARRHNVNPQVTKVLRKYLASTFRENATRAEAHAVEGASAPCGLAGQGGARSNFTAGSEAAGSSGQETLSVDVESLAVRLRGGGGAFPPLCGNADRSGLAYLAHARESGSRMRAAETWGLDIWGAQGADGRRDVARLVLRGGGTRGIQCAAPTASRSHVPTGSSEANASQDEGSKPHQALGAGPPAHDARVGGLSLAEGKAAPRALAAGCEKRRGRRQRRQTAGWQGRYLAMMHYRLLHGHTDMSQTEGGLGMWAAIQR